MTKKEIKSRIRVTGIWGDFEVHHDMPGEAIVCHVSQADIGHAIVRALRQRAFEQQDAKRNRQSA